VLDPTIDTSASRANDLACAQPSGASEPIRRRIGGAVRVDGPTKPAQQVTSMRSLTQIRTRSPGQRRDKFKAYECSVRAMPAEQSDAHTARRVQTMSLFARRAPQRKASEGLCRKLLVQRERLNDLATQRDAPTMRIDDLAKATPQVAEDGRPMNPNRGARCHCSIV
jgi:hypothetical protein